MYDWRDRGLWAPIFQTAQRCIPPSVVATIDAILRDCESDRVVGSVGRVFVLVNNRAQTDTRGLEAVT